MKVRKTKAAPTTAINITHNPNPFIASLNKPKSLHMKKKMDTQEERTEKEGKRYENPLFSLSLCLSSKRFFFFFGLPSTFVVYMQDLFFFFLGGQWPCAPAAVAAEPVNGIKCQHCGKTSLRMPLLSVFAFLRTLVSGFLGSVGLLVRFQCISIVRLCFLFELKLCFFFLFFFFL